MTTLSVVAVHPVAEIGTETLLSLAAAAPAGDPVTEALKQEAAHDLHHSDFDPASPARKYSLAQVHEVTYGGRARRVAVMRGDVEEVLAHSASTGEQRKLARVNAGSLAKLGHRSLGVAVAEITDDQTDEFRFQGIVTLGVGGHRRVKAPTRAGYTRVTLWPAALRIQHWLNLILIVALSVSGYYIMNPFFGPAASADTGYLMGLIRAIHFIAGFGWIAVALWRLSLTVFAKQRHMRWRSLWPVYGREDLRSMVDTIAYYSFLRKHGPHYLGHNVLQQFTYSGIYLLCTIQILSGLALYGLYDQSNGFFVLLSYPVHWVGIPIMRLIHAIIMFIIWAFVVLHIYLAFRNDAVEGHGGVSAMINGGVWVPVGTKPVDHPEID